MFLPCLEALGRAMGHACVGSRKQHCAELSCWGALCVRCRYYTQGSFVSTSMILPQWILDIPPGPDKHVAAMQFYYVSSTM